jgi:adenylate kinase
LNEVIDCFFNGNSSSETNDSFKDSRRSKIAIIEGHLSHLCNIDTNDINKDISVDFKVLVLRLNPNILQNRLQSRNYSEKKIHENLEAEALGVCSVEAYENHGENVNEIDTSDLDFQEVLTIVCDVLFDKKHFPVGNVDFLQWILD